jgi:hypothetical protein
MIGTRAVSFLGPGETDSGAALTDPGRGGGTGAETVAGFSEGTGEGAGEANDGGGTTTCGGFGGADGSVGGSLLAD